MTAPWASTSCSTSLAATTGDPSGASTACAWTRKGNIVGTAGNYLSGPGPMIYVWTPQGRVLETYPMPVGVDGPTNCCFGDADQSSLYVTSGQGHLLRLRDSGRRGWIMWPPVR